MPVSTVPNAVQAEVRYLLNLQQVENTLSFFNSDGFSPVELDDLAEAVYTWWHDSLAAVQSTDVKFSEVLVRSLDFAQPYEGSFTPPSAATGSIATEAMPGNVTLSVSFRSGATGRSNRGRNYMVGIPRSQVEGAIADAGYGDDVVAAYTALLGEGALPAGWQWVIVSRFLDKVQRDPGVTIAVNSVRLVDLIVDSQRRRLPGRGS